jgi:hypothetical protein
MIDDKKLLVRFLIQIPLFILTLTIYGLSFSIIDDTIKRASVAQFQFAGNGVSLEGISIGFIWLCVFYLLALIPSCYSLFIYGLAHLLFNSITEPLFFKFTSCFYFQNNAIVVARASLTILLMLYVVSVALIEFVNFLKRGQTWKEKSRALFLVLLIILPSIGLLAINAILIAHLKPQLTHDIRPSTLSMGFFNPLEISQIRNGTYAKTSTFEQQIIGNLGDIIFSPLKVKEYYYDCEKDYHVSSIGRLIETTCQKNCSSFYDLHTYSYQIPCTNQSVSFYKDCANAFSLTIYVTYLDSGPYPSFNCLVNQANQKCASLCTQLLSHYQLILIQEFEPNQVRPAWTGLSSCDTNINSQLTQDSRLDPCSFAMKQSFSKLFLFIGILLSLCF